VSRAGDILSIAHSTGWYTGKEHETTGLAKFRTTYDHEPSDVVAKIMDALSLPQTSGFMPGDNSDTFVMYQNESPDKMTMRFRKFPEQDTELMQGGDLGELRAKVRKIVTEMGIKELPIGKDPLMSDTFITTDLSSDTLRINFCKKRRVKVHEHRGAGD
jgi:hypothetical protein